MDRILELRKIIDENEQILKALENKLSRTSEENVQLDILQIRTQNIYEEYWEAIHNYVGSEI